jgi:hypothetical protein
LLYDNTNETAIALLFRVCTAVIAHTGGPNPLSGNDSGHGCD